jgi:site-specific DNA-methyltransferase (adenine-specific)
MKPYYRDDWVTIYHGDCREVLPGIHADAVISDPPYGVQAAEWDSAAPIDLLPTYLSITGSGLVTLFGAAPRLVVDLQRYSPPPQRILVWSPRFTLSRVASHGIAFRWHPVYVWNLPKKHGGPVWDVLDDPTECGNWWEHPATKPESLMRRLVQLAPPGATVADPFAGSGTTLVAAKATGRRAIGVESDPGYCEVAARRAQETLALGPSAPAPERAQEALAI